MEGHRVGNPSRDEHQEQSARAGDERASAESTRSESDDARPASGASPASPDHRRSDGPIPRVSVVNEQPCRPAPPDGAFDEEYRWHTYKVYPSGRPDAIEFIETYKAFGRAKIYAGRDMLGSENPSSGSSCRASRKVRSRWTRWPRDATSPENESNVNRKAATIATATTLTAAVTVVAMASRAPLSRSTPVDASSARAPVAALAMLLVGCGIVVLATLVALIWPARRRGAEREPEFAPQPLRLHWLWKLLAVVLPIALGAALGVSAVLGTRTRARAQHPSGVVTVGPVTRTPSSHGASHTTFVVPSWRPGLRSRSSSSRSRRCCCS
jgi:hypothetical protein